MALFGTKGTKRDARFREHDEVLCFKPPPLKTTVIPGLTRDPGSQEAAFIQPTLDCHAHKSALAMTGSLWENGSSLLPALGRSGTKNDPVYFLTKPLAIGSTHGVVWNKRNQTGCPLSRA